ncbi:Beta-lactamase [Williamsia sterculiae]|uniref:Beta-lactamase n=2 Tax=Williamsia sterculiae TaxID=1344003 RepID=A0A1N7HA79_9NOCA|nr:Beta-lactamase [Williamsia sterculiae]
MLTDPDLVISVVVAGVIGVRLVLAGLARVRRPPSAVGDPTLARFLDSHATRATHRLVVIVAEPGSVRSAYIRADRTSAFEVGSVSKVFTALLVADAVDRGVLTADTTAGELCPLTGDAATATVGQLATHRSGLPRIPGDATTMLRGLAFAIWGANPYRGTGRDRLLATVDRARIRHRGDVRTYSNMGAALLGHLAVAASGEESYDVTVRDRVWARMGMTATGVSTRARHAPRGWRGGLRPAQWSSEGYAPAGGVVSTPDDMARFAAAMVGGDVPGLATALSPVDGGGGDPWLWARGRQPMSFWHNGETGGYSAYVSLVRGDRPRATVLMSDRAPVTPIMRLAEQVARVG